LIAGLEKLFETAARVPSHLPESLHQRLGAYALAASAAGVGVMALAQPAEARVVYTPAGESLGASIGHVYEIALDLNHDGINDFALVNYLTIFFDDVLSGFLIGNWGNFGRRHERLFFVSKSATGGEWKDAANRYLGLKFKIDGKIHYGSRLSARIPQSYDMVGTLTGYAYETIPKQPIIAGETHGKDGIAVQPAALGALATGSSALSTGRHHQGASK
jgi:hypothetical protein